MRDDRRRLIDIVDAIGQIEKYAHQGREAFETDEMLQVWVVYHLQIIGEAANGLSETLLTSAAEIPWLDIIGMRNILIHRYWGIDPDIVWGAVEAELPKLKSAVMHLLAD